MSERISVVVPVLNERENIQPFFDSLWQVLLESREDFEIVFVDDGSTDGSSGLLEALAARSTNRMRTMGSTRIIGRGSGCSG